MADAYIDPGTAGTFFSSLGPILGVIGVVVVGALAFARGYVQFVLSSLWRRRMWLLILAAGLLVGAVVYVVIDCSGAGRTAGALRAPWVFAGGRWTWHCRDVTS